MWKALLRLNKNPQLQEVLENAAQHGGSPKLAELLFNTSAVTLTGRLRSNISYTSALNTPFSGLAADGAKLAIFDLAQIGYRIVSFIHDELVIELEENCNLEQHKQLIQTVMENAMKRALCDPTLPIKTTAYFSDSWWSGS